MDKGETLVSNYYDGGESYDWSGVCPAGVLMCPSHSLVLSELMGGGHLSHSSQVVSSNIPRGHAGGGR